MVYTDRYLYIQFVIFATLSIGFACSRLGNSDFGKNVKSLVMKRHITYILVYLLLNSYAFYCMLAYFQFIDPVPVEAVDDEDTITRILQTMFYS